MFDVACQSDESKFSIVLGSKEDTYAYAHKVSGRGVEFLDDGERKGNEPTTSFTSSKRNRINFLEGGNILRKMAFNGVAYGGA